MVDTYKYSTMQTPVAVFNTKIVQYYLKLSTTQTPVGLIAVKVLQYSIRFSTNQTPVGSIMTVDGVNFEVELGQFSNNAFTKLASNTVRVPMNPREISTVAIITKDNGSNVEVTVRFFNRSNLNKWETTFTVSKMVGVNGGIGLYTENQSEVDNVTIMYNKT